MKNHLVFCYCCSLLVCLGCSKPLPQSGTLTPSLNKEDQADAAATAQKAIVEIEAMPDVPTRKAYLAKHLDVANAFGGAKDDALNARLRRALGY